MLELTFIFHSHIGFLKEAIMAEKKGKYDYYQDGDFIKCFAEANGDVELMNELFGKTDNAKEQENRSVSKASIQQRRNTIRKVYGIKLRVARQSKFQRMEKDDARALARTLGFEIDRGDDLS